MIHVGKMNKSLIFAVISSGCFCSSHFPYHCYSLVKAVGYESHHRFKATERCMFRVKTQQRERIKKKIKKVQFG